MAFDVLGDFLHHGRGLSDAEQIVLDSRQIISADHIHHGLSFDVDGLHIVLQHDLAAGFQFCLREHLVLNEHLHVLLVQQMRHGIRGGLQVGQAAHFRGFLHPFLPVSVAVKEDALMGSDDFLDKIVQLCLEILCCFQPVGILAQTLRHSGVEHHVAAGDAVGRSQRPELEFVSGKCKRRCPVPVRGISGEAGQRMHAQLHHHFFLSLIGSVRLDGIQNGRQLISQKDGDDGGRCFVRSQTMVVAGGGNGQTQKILIIVHGLQYRAEEKQELCVLVGSLSRRQQVHALIRGDGPVVVFAGSVDAGKGLFMQQAHQTVAAGNFLHDLHGELVVVRGNVGGGVDGSQFVLGRCHLVVFRLGKDPQLPELIVQVFHELRDSRLDDAEIVVVQLLALGGHGTEKGPAGIHQVRAFFIHLLIDEKILLLRSHAGADIIGFGTEKLQDPLGLTVQCLHGPQKRCLLIQCLPGIRAECRGDAQGVIFNKGIGRRIPGGISAGFECRPDTAGRERRCIRFAFDQFLAGKLHDHASVRRGGDETVVFLRCNAS